MIQIDLLTQRSSSNAVITLRSRWPVVYRDEAKAIAGGVALVKAWPEVLGFVLLLPSQRAELDGINASAYEERTITRAIAARRARQARKAALQAKQASQNNAGGALDGLAGGSYA